MKWRLAKKIVGNSGHYPYGKCLTAASKYNRVVHRMSLLKGKTYLKVWIVRRRKCIFRLVNTIPGTDKPTYYYAGRIIEGWLK